MSAIEAEVTVETKQPAGAAPSASRSVAFVVPDLSKWNFADEGNFIVKEPRVSASGFRLASIEMKEGRFLIRLQHSAQKPGMLPFGVGRGKFKNVNTSVELDDTAAEFFESLQNFLKNHLFEHQEHHFGKDARKMSREAIDELFIDFYTPRMQNKKKADQTYEPKLAVKVPLVGDNIAPGKIVMGEDRRNVVFEDLLNADGDKARRMRFTDLLIDVGYFHYGRGQHGATLTIEKLHLADDVGSREPVDFDNLADRAINATVVPKRGLDADDDAGEERSAKRARPTIL